ncbi:beta-ketoacyl synthase N-terminal-like domain-containing protein [Streptomyces sp. NPDC050161]|uniref:polyketide synthase n=1 Tax=Streptomyces sp. NPDC050161 TaxID=3365604 RepID=UPI0037A1C902
MGIASDGDTGAAQPAPEEAGAIAVVGLSCRFPRAAGPEAFWRLLHDGTPPAGGEPQMAGHPDRGRTGAAACLDSVNRFEPEFFGIAASEAAAMDPQQRLVLELAWEALESAGILPEGLAGSETGVFIGADEDTAPLRPHEAGAARTAPTGLSRGTLANRVSYVFGLRGPSLVIDTAQSSALTAVHLACQALRAGECSEALAGGAAAHLISDADSPVGGARAAGGVVVLKTLRRALADGDTVHCLIRGGAVNNDGGGTPAGPLAAAQEDVLRRAYAHAGADPAAARFVELHGAGTADADLAEKAALHAVLGCARPARAPLLVSSVRAAVGQPAGAVGIAALIKAVLCLREAVLVAGSPHTEASPEAPHLRAGDGVRPLVRHGGEPVLAGVSAFGAGGTNCHVVLSDWRPRRAAPATAAERPSGEEAGRPGPARRDHGGLPVPWVLSTGIADALRTRPARPHAHPGRHPDDLAHTLAPARDAAPYRAVLVGADRDGFADAAAELDDEQVLEIIGELPLQRLREAGLLSRLLELAGHR